MSVTGADLKRLRERRSLSQSELAEIINQALGRNYTSGSVSPWENDKRAIPPGVAAFVEELLLDTALQTGENGSAPSADQDPAGDTLPGGGKVDAPPGQTAIGQPDIWARACEELWELIATGVGMTGAATGSEALMLDGAIIANDKEALGRAWGKLAETNETFRKMLVGMTEGGAWLQVAMVTGTTVSKCYQGHAEIAARKRSQTAGGYGEPEPAAAA